LSPADRYAATRRRVSAADGSKSPHTVSIERVRARPIAVDDATSASSSTERSVSIRRSGHSAKCARKASAMER